MDTYVRLAGTRNDCLLCFLSLLAGDTPRDFESTVLPRRNFVYTYLVHVDVQREPAGGLARRVVCGSVKYFYGVETEVSYVCAVTGQYRGKANLFCRSYLRAVDNGDGCMVFGLYGREEGTEGKGGRGGALFYDLDAMLSRCWLCSRKSGAFFIDLTFEVAE